MRVSPPHGRLAYIVDDQPTITRAVARALRRMGYDVGIAHTADQALAEIAATRPQLVIMDIQLPGQLSGVEIAARLRAAVDAPIVFLTGAIEPPLDVLDAHEGVYAYLPKPFAPVAFRATVELVRMQHEARARLRDLQQRNEALIDLLASTQRMGAFGSYRYDLLTGRMTWTEETYRLHGLSPAAFAPTAENVLALVHPDDRAFVADAMTTVPTPAFAGSLAFRVVWPDGTIRSLSLRRERIIDGSGAVVGVVGTVQDVTEQAAAEAAIRASEARYHSIFVHAVGGIVRTALDGTIQDANPALVAILGCRSAAELIGTTLASWFATPSNALTLDGWRPGAPRDATWRRKDGTFACVQLDGLVLGEGTDRHFLGFVRDLTVERERMTREREAIAASRAKTDFLAHMSHELRTPLNAVLGLSEALLERTFGELDDRQADALATIHDSGRHLLALINDVLDIARVEAGKLPIEPELVPLRPLIDESAALVYGQLSAKGQRLVIELEPTLPPVDVDRRRIKQVLLNLLGNAVKFSPLGATVTLRALARDDRRRIALSVSDTGRGIDPADRQRIFEPFVTLDRAMTHDHGGAGLGLALAKRIVELHGGTLEVDSEVGVGSTFVITLPVASAYTGEVEVHPRRTPDAPGAPRRDGEAPTILLVEDNEANVITFRQYLEARGSGVQGGGDGIAGGGAGSDPEVAVILMDVQLPGLDGLEATRRIRSGGGADKPIIALTAYAMPGDEARCLAAGASAYMAKPVRLRDLADTIERFVSADGSS